MTLRLALLCVLALLAAGTRAESGPDAGIWAQRIEEDARRESFTLSSRKPNYLLVTGWSPNQAPYAQIGSDERLEGLELKFQLNLQTKMGDDLFGSNGDLWFSYTQVSFWQAFNGSISAPFRETNYEPEVFLSFLTDYRLPGLSLRTISLGAVHQSNGRAEPLSRSWNRVYAEFQFARGDLGLIFRPWVITSESDANSDIENYLGRYELRLLYNWKGQIFSAMGRNLFDGDGRYNAELSWSFPIKGRLRGLVQYYKGYGENLIDYNYNTRRLGIGVMLTNWL
jgi:phospholipase A1